MNKSKLFDEKEKKMIEFKIENNKLIKCTTNNKLVNIPEKISYIDTKAFYNNKQIEEINMNDDVYRIGHSVFEECNSLKKIKLSKNLRELPGATFKHCYE